MSIECQQPAPIRLVYRHPDFVVVDKPIGLTVQRSQQQPGVLEQLGQQLQVAQLYPVHRLDRMTSGLLVCALHAEAAAQLSQQFAQRQVQKYYLALGHGKPKKKQGKVVGDLLPSRRGSWRLAPSCDNPSVTQFFSWGTQAGYRVFLLKPYTGKTHQLRVVLKSLGTPILGDPRYHTASHTQYDRGYLHAYALTLNYGENSYHWRCPPQQGQLFAQPEIAKIISQLAEPWQLAWPAHQSANRL